MDKAKSAELILKLYELRRDETMREARRWIISFFPESAADVLKVMVDEKTSAHYRMVTTYWEMAAGFVVHEAIDEEMFDEAHAEHIVVFSKIEPFLTELRATMGAKYLKNLETLIMRTPNAKEMLHARRELMKRWMQTRAAATESAAN